MAAFWESPTSVSSFLGPASLKCRTATTGVASCASTTWNGYRLPGSRVNHASDREWGFNGRAVAFIGPRPSHLGAKRNAVTAFDGEGQAANLDRSKTAEGAGQRSEDRAIGAQQFLGRRPTESRWQAIR